jgi:predicted nuclease with TOPRIM domain
MVDQSDLDASKAKRGWWFAVVFLLVVVGLVVFLAHVQIVEQNRDVLIGILGVITGSISSMMAIASGRDPSEVEDLREKLAKANADREALIARLRDAQIQLQLHRDQLADLQFSIIERLSILANDVQRRDPELTELKDTVAQWLPSSEEP